MIYTSYFSKCKKWDNSKTFSIAKFAPFWKGRKYEKLFPTEKIIFDYKNGLINEEQYTECYRKEILSKLDPKVIGSQLEGCTLLCYEKTGTFCHRHIIAQWLRESGFEVVEIK